MKMKEEKFWYVRGKSETSICDPAGLASKRAAAWNHMLGKRKLGAQQRAQEIRKMRAEGWKCVQVSAREI